MKYLLAAALLALGTPAAATNVNCAMVDDRLGMGAVASLSLVAQHQAQD